MEGSTTTVKTPQMLATSMSLFQWIGIEEFADRLWAYCGHLNSHSCTKHWKLIDQGASILACLDSLTGKFDLLIKVVFALISPFGSTYTVPVKYLDTLSQSFE